MQITSIFDKQLFPPSCHCSTIAGLENGDLYSVWYIGSYETARDTVLMGAEWDRKERTWTNPEIIIDLPDVCVGNPVLYRHEDGVLWLFYVILKGEEWTSSKIIRARSEDNGKSWTDQEIIFDKTGLMTKTAPLLLEDKTLLLPVYDEKKWCSHVLLSHPPYDDWHLYGDTTSRGITIQPSLLERRDGVIEMYSRSTRGKIYRSLSYNKGLSWTASQPLPLANPNSGIDLLKLESGSWLLVRNDLESGRHRLVVERSQDRGETWGERLLLEDSEGEFSYPFALQATDNNIHIVYTWQRTKIKHVILQEEDLEGK